MPRKTVAHTDLYTVTVWANQGSYVIQGSLYFKTTHGTKKMWSYIAGGLKIKVIYHR